MNYMLYNVVDFLVAVCRGVLQCVAVTTHVHGYPLALVHVT